MSCACNRQPAEDSSGKLQRSLCRERYLNEELALL